MKHLKICLIALLIGLMSACSSDEFQIPIQSERPILSKDCEFNDSHRAIEIANIVLGKTVNTSRGTNCCGPEILCVLNGFRSRGETVLPDTLAYVVNYPEDDGFVIVSSDNHVFPVLAFSETGNFSFDNENVKENFTDRIGAYISENQDKPIQKLGSIIDIGRPIVKPYIVEPKLRICMNQREPYSKYVDRAHPGWPVGCVPVAMATIMSHAAHEFEYEFYGTWFYFDDILNIIEKSNSSNPIGPVDSRYTIDEATDLMAKLVYYLGIDLPVSYEKTTGGSLISGASSSDARALMGSLGYEVSNQLFDFDSNDVVQYLIDDHLIYIAGTKVNGLGHAWVIDGCEYLPFNYTDPESAETTEGFANVYFHCDWGWNGKSNGFYTGSIFALKDADGEYTGQEYKPNRYFAVTRYYENIDE